jgi:hypothetical protein
MNSLQILPCKGHRASRCSEQGFEFAGEPSIAKLATKFAEPSGSIRLGAMLGGR